MDARAGFLERLGLHRPELRAWADLPDGDYFAEVIVTVPALGHRGTFRRHLAVRGATPRHLSARAAALLRPQHGPCPAAQPPALLRAPRGTPHGIGFSFGSNRRIHNPELKSFTYASPSFGFTTTPHVIGAFGSFALGSIGMNSAI